MFSNAILVTVWRDFHGIERVNALVKARQRDADDDRADGGEHERFPNDQRPPGRLDERRQARPGLRSGLPLPRPCGRRH